MGEGGGGGCFLRIVHILSSIEFDCLKEYAIFLARKVICNKGVLHLFFKKQMVLHQTSFLCKIQSGFKNSLKNG